MARATDGGIQAAKAARNQARWRELNERVRFPAERSGDVEFVCECVGRDCSETLRLSVAAYERIGSSPIRFPIAVGHDSAAVETVVQMCDQYAVVEKRGKAAKIAAHFNPRSK